MKVIVLDLKGNGLDVESKSALGNLITVSLSELAAFDVVSGAEVRSLIELEGQKQTVGCDQDMACLAEIAGALGARLIVHGSVERLGSVLLFSLTLHDTKTASPVGRTALQGGTLDALANALPAKVQQMAIPFLQAEGLSTSKVQTRAMLAGSNEGLALVGGITAVVGAAVFLAVWVGSMTLAAQARAPAEVMEAMKVPVAGKFIALGQLSDEAFVTGEAPALLGAAVLETIGAGAAVGGAAAFAGARMLDGPELSGAGEAWRWGFLGGGAALVVGGIVFDTASPTSSDRTLQGFDVVAPALEVTGVAAMAIGVLVNPLTDAE